MPTRIEIKTQGFWTLTTIRRSTATALLVLALAPGCSDQGAAGAVDPPVAREALRITLEAWKKGEPIDSLQAGSPSVVAQDLDWLAGLKLVSYEVEGEGKLNDVNLRVPVQLTLQTPQGKEVKKNVTYVVGTSPAVTVFRDFP
ncbi:MAG: hypothetical protein AB7I30_02240 [Isosphaeraceae bacterium]